MLYRFRKLLRNTICFTAALALSTVGMFTYAAIIVILVQ